MGIARRSVSVCLASQPGKLASALLGTSALRSNDRCVRWQQPARSIHVGDVPDNTAPDTAPAGCANAARKFTEIVNMAARRADLLNMVIKDSGDDQC